MECQEWLTFDKEVRISRLDTDTAIERDLHHCRYHSRHQLHVARRSTGHWTLNRAVSWRLTVSRQLWHAAHAASAGMHVSPWSVSHQSAGSATAALIIGRFLTHRALHGTVRARSWSCGLTDWPHGQPPAVVHVYVTPIHLLPALAADTETRVAAVALSVLCLIHCLIS